MKASNNLVELLLEPAEGFSPGPYQHPGDRPTIGYGSTFYANGTPVTMQDKPITKQQAAILVLATLGQYEDCVNKYVKVKLNQNQFDALVDFCYNEGNEKFINSTLLKKLNAGDFSGAALEIDKWIYAAGRIEQGLVTRRKNERLLFIRIPS
jgi:lysozyme